MSIVGPCRLCGMVSADPIIVVPYDEDWPSLYEEERARIERAIGPWAEGIEHVGSTAVLGLAAKRIIDIMVGVRSFDDSPTLVERLVGIGYEYVSEFERVMPFRRYFRKMRKNTPASSTNFRAAYATIGRHTRMPRPTSSRRSSVALRRISEANNFQ